jgi:hypothetical protein
VRAARHRALVTEQVNLTHPGGCPPAGNSAELFAYLACADRRASLSNLEDSMTAETPVLDTLAGITAASRSAVLSRRAS